MRPKIVALFAVSVLALAGCSSTSEPAPKPTESAAPEARQAIEPPAGAPKDEAAGKKEQTEEAFLVEYKQVGGLIEPYTEKEIIEYGYETCQFIEKGESVPLDMVGESGQDHSVGIAAGMAAKVELCQKVTQ